MSRINCFILEVILTSIISNLTDSPAAEVMEQFTRATSVMAKCSNNRTHH